MKVKMLFMLVLLVALSIVPMLAITAKADGPSDETLYAAYMCKGGLGLPALQWYTTDYGNKHPGLNWVVATPSILNDYCGSMVVNPDTQQASWVVRVAAPYLRATYNAAAGVSATSK